MGQSANHQNVPDEDRTTPVLSFDTRYRLGSALRSVYEDSVDRQPIPDAQVELLLRLRHRERDRRARAR